jgi:hypothetical protein
VSYFNDLRGFRRGLCLRETAIDRKFKYAITYLIGPSTILPAARWSFGAKLSDT